MTVGLETSHIVAGVIEMPCNRQLSKAPSLINTQHADDVGSARAADVGCAECTGDKVCTTCANTQVGDGSRLVNSLIFERDGARHAVAELSGVGELVHTGHRAAAAGQTVEVVSRIVGPRGRELRDCLTHREAGELDEGVVDAERTAGDRAGVGVLRGRSGRNRSAAAEGLVNGRTGRCGVAAVAAGRPGEGRIEIGANHAVFGRGARIDVEIFTGTSGVVVGIAVAGASDAADLTVVHAVGVQRGFNAQITTQLDAGVGAGDVVETRTIKRADPHVLDRFGLDGKISCLSPTHGEQTRR